MQALQNQRREEQHVEVTFTNAPARSCDCEQVAGIDDGEETADRGPGTGVGNADTCLLGDLVGLLALL